MPPERKDSIEFPIGNTTPLRDESIQKQGLIKLKIQDKHQSRSEEGRQHSMEKEKTRGKEKGNREGRSKRSKDRDYESDKAKPRPKEKDREGRLEKERRSKERNYKEHSRERSYERERHPPSDHQQDQMQPEGIPPQVLQNPSLDPAFNQASMLVQSIRQSTSAPSAHPNQQQHQFPGAAPDSQLGGSSGGHPPHTGAPYAGGADGMYHQSSQGGYPNAPGSHFPNHPGHPPQHQYGMSGQQQYPPPPVQQYHQSDQYHQAGSAQQQGAGFLPMPDAYNKDPFSSGYRSQVHSTIPEWEEKKRRNFLETLGLLMKKIFSCMVMGTAVKKQHKFHNRKMNHLILIPVQTFGLNEQVQQRSTSLR